MSTVWKSLDDISTGYSRFEKDQVLTHDQLNSVGDYFDDQTRLSRVALLGVGIVCGLEVSQTNASIRVTQGAGVTTDGDLVFLHSDAIFDSFKPYDDSRPRYNKFYVNDQMITVHELVHEDATDPQAVPLSEIPNLNQMVAIAFMESFVKDDDICTGTDCDNLGQDHICNLKILLVDKSSIGQLNTKMPTTRDAFEKLQPVAAMRVLLHGDVSASANLREAFQLAAQSIHEALLDEIDKVFSICRDLFGDSVFSADPTGVWKELLEKLKSQFSSRNSIGMQYYYDFFKDLAETYNAFRDSLFEDATICVPDPDRFPKHLLLGALNGQGNHRTELYPSPLVSHTVAALHRTRFLAKKLDVQIRSFKLSDSEAIRVTPSRTEATRLEDRAIPAYYDIVPNDLHENWSYQRHQRGMDNHNLSYHAASYSNVDAVQAPLKYQIGQYDFFRVEGIEGQDVDEVTKGLKKTISDFNLPFCIQTVVIAPDRDNVRRELDYTDLHSLHYLLRQDLNYQLEDSKSFSDTLRDQVKAAANDTVIVDDRTERQRYLDLADNKTATIQGKASVAQAQMALKYSEFSAITNSNWESNVSDVMQASVEFKQETADLSQTVFATPYDSLASNTQVRWIGWLRDIIKQDKEEKDDRLVFRNFIQEHPGLEHLGGVPRGGTLVLIYNQAGKIVLDCALPYCCCIPTRKEPDEPPLPKPKVKPKFVVEQGMKFIIPQEKFVSDQFLQFEAKIDKTITDKVEVQDRLIDAFQSFATSKDLGVGGGVVQPGDLGVGGGVVQPGDLGVGGGVVQPGDLGTGGGVVQPGDLGVGGGVVQPGDLGVGGGVVQPGDLGTGGGVVQPGDLGTGGNLDAGAVVRPGGNLGTGGNLDTGAVVRPGGNLGAGGTGGFVRPGGDSGAGGFVRPGGNFRLGDNVVIPPGSGNDRVLDVLVTEAKFKQSKTDALRDEALRPELPHDKKAELAKRTNLSETELSKAVSAVMTHISESKQSFAVGSEAQAAVMAVVRSINSIRHAGVKAELFRDLRQLSKKTENPDLKTLLENLSER